MRNKQHGQGLNDNYVAELQLGDQFINAGGPDINTFHGKVRKPIYHVSIAGVLVMKS